MKGTVFKMKQKSTIIVVLTLIMMVTVYQIGKAEPQGNSAQIEVNDTAIRIRIIPNSNKYEDQQAKKMVRYAMDEYLNSNKSSFETVESTREFITNNIGQIEETVAHVLDTINYESGFEVSYGAHLFPEKQYNGETYEQGYYESLVITIGEGRGNNWWCFMNPDLCLGPSAKASESNESSDWNNQYNAMETTQEAFQEKKFKSYIAEVFDNFFGDKETEAYVSSENVEKESWYLYEDEY